MRSARRQTDVFKWGVMNARSLVAKQGTYIVVCWHWKFTGVRSVARTESVGGRSNGQMGSFFSYLTNDLEYGRVGRGDDCDLYRDGHAGRIQHIDRHACLTAFLANSSDFRNWASTGHHRTKIVNNITAFFWKWQVESRVQHWCFSVYFFALIEVFFGLLLCEALLSSG